MHSLETNGIVDFLLDQYVYVQQHDTLPSVFDECFGKLDATAAKALIIPLLRDQSRIMQGEEWRP